MRSYNHDFGLESNIATVTSKVVDDNVKSVVVCYEINLRNAAGGPVNAPSMFRTRYCVAASRSKAPSA